MKSVQAKAGKQIRKILKEAFPDTKFRVRSKSFSGGSSVNVSWTDGPTSTKVEKKVKMFQYGHFDGMRDIYEHSNSRDDIPQVRFVMCNRKMSDRAQQQIIDEHNSTFVESAQIKDINGYNEDAQCWNNSLVYRKFAEKDFMGVTGGMKNEKNK